MASTKEIFSFYWSEKNRLGVQIAHGGGDDIFSAICPFATLAYFVSIFNFTGYSLGVLLYFCDIYSGSYRRKETGCNLLCSNLSGYPLHRLRSPALQLLEYYHHA